ncbi:AI-2E family transporter [Luteimonas sp. SJ-92]|uniref:AI-2E family transporter n=1 Tax=Luteimonas salinisoli TaxID=2752307 RepID=A0A853J9E8_9GAMM|nr:AI-2E family transporter [Luteimonas salinisoli]NZA25773.1 AI-2E family transporter [Luteimonas salinisoli]
MSVAQGDRLQSVVHGAVLALIVGWVLYVGKQVFVPMVFGVLVAYVIIGLARALTALPLVGRWLPAPLRYLLSILGIGVVVAAGVSLVVNNFGRVVQLAPTYQDTLLQRIQQGAEFFGLRAAPTWTALREDFLAQVRLQDLIGSTVVSVTGVGMTVLIVLLYVTFLLLEKRVFPAKLRSLSDDPRDVSRIHQVLDSINSRTGQYLSVKTLVNVLLGVVSWAMMAPFGLEFAGFWAVLIAVLNYVPYIGSFLGVLFPVAWAIVQFGDPGTVITLLLLLASAQFVIGNFLDPYLMGNSLNLSPFVILASLLTWGGLWGIPGAFLAVPITAVLAIVLSEFPGTRPIAVLMSRNGRLDGRRGGPRGRAPAGPPA